MEDFFQKDMDSAFDHRVYLDIPTLLIPEPAVKTDYLSLLDSRSINIVYSGVLSLKQRNPIPIINLLNQCVMSEKINLLFFSMGADDILTDAATSFRGSIIQHNYIPLNELHTIYQHADYLLNISHVNPNMVPSKLFEYMSYGKPIISAYCTDGDASKKCLIQYPEGISIDLKRDDSENVAILNTFLSSNHNEVPFEIVKKKFYNNTPERYLALINEVLTCQ
jgi:hypothetical protein